MKAADVRYWHFADNPITLRMSAIGIKRTWRCVRFSRYDACPEPRGRPCDGASSSRFSAARRRRGRSPRVRSRASACGASACSCPQPRTIAEFQAWVGAFLQDAGAIGLDHRPQCADRHPLGHDQCRRHSQACGGIGRARTGRHPGLWRLDRRAVAAGYPHRADRVPGRRRSGRRRLRRQPGAAGRQRHRVHVVRIQHGREMAGAAQADRAKRDASGGLRDPATPTGTGQFGAIQAVAPSLRVEVNPVNMRDAGEIERAVAAFARLRMAV